MAIRKVFEQGEEILAKTCKPVPKITERIKILAGDMVDTMRASDGVGIAAPQVGVMKRLFVALPDPEQPDDIYVMINPEILEQDGEQECIEGCLSVPGYVGYVKRPEHIKIKAQDLDGEWHEYEFSGFGANVMCHENDHLDGILYTDKADKIMTNEEYDEMLEQIKKEKEGKTD